MSYPPFVPPHPHKGAIRTGWRRSALLLACASLVVFPLLFGQSMGRSLGHDEHQHLAAGVLVAKEGLLPYRDFPFFHTPVLPLIYGLFLGHCEYLLLATRTFSTICAALIAGLLFLVGFHAFASPGRWRRVAFASMGPLLFVTCPVVVFTAGRTSNHDLSTLFAFLATLCHLAVIRNPTRGSMVFLSGLLLALAIGTRVTFAPLILPFIVLLIVVSRGRARLSRLAIFAVGGVVGMLPVLWLFYEAPARAFYGVLQFSLTNLDYREATGSPQNMTLLTKLRFLFKEIIVPNFAVIAAAFVPLAVFEWQRRGAGIRFPRELTFLLALLPFLLAGSLAPSPAFEQYFFAIVPFLLLIGFLSASRIRISSRADAPVVAFCVILLSVSTFAAWDGFRNLDEMLTPQKWTPIKRHMEARELANYSAGRILTLAPIHVLEAGLKIDPSFVTGPFAWRVADFLPPGRRQEVGLVGAEDLEAHLIAHPVDAILVGHEQQWEPALVAYAQRHGYRRVSMGDETEAIWLKPGKTAESHEVLSAR